VTLDLSSHPEDAKLRPTYVTVDLARLRSNLEAIRARVSPSKVMLIPKANAYGHGIEAVARYLAPHVDLVGVALLEEGIELRRMGIERPILVMGGIWSKQIPRLIEHGLMMTVPSLDRLRDADEAAAALGLRARVHLKIDTGAERVGIHHYHADRLLDASLRVRHVDVEGIYSHLANADAFDLSHARLQLERFGEVLRFYERRSIRTPLRHIANSAAVLRLPESHLDLVRPGLLLYGVYPTRTPPAGESWSVAVAPAMSWRSRVVYFKVVEAGNPVSYGSTWQSDHRVRMVTVPVGYGDGYFRSMSNKARVIVRGRRYPQVGTICMDQMMVNIEWDSAYNGDEVILIGESGGQRVSVEDLADWAGTIPYEILTAINDRVPRIYPGSPHA
jgi:alanine racemase